MQWPLSNDRLVLSVWDHDTTSPDEIVGSIVLSLKDLVKNCSKAGGELRWVNIYGAPTGLVMGPHMKKMNENPEVASMWKGRVLLHLEIADCKTPERAVVDLDEAILKLCEERGVFKLNEYQVQFELGAGICLPADKKYKVRMAIGDFKQDSDAALEHKPSYNRWS